MLGPDERVPGLPSGDANHSRTEPQARSSRPSEMIRVTSAPRPVLPLSSRVWNVLDGFRSANYGTPVPSVSGRILAIGRPLSGTTIWPQREASRTHSPVRACNSRRVTVFICHTVTRPAPVGGRHRSPGAAAEPIPIRRGITRVPPASGRRGRRQQSVRQSGGRRYRQERRSDVWWSMGHPRGSSTMDP